MFDCTNNLIWRRDSLVSTRLCSCVLKRKSFLFHFSVSSTKYIYISLHMTEEMKKKMMDVFSLMFDTEKRAHMKMFEGGKKRIFFRFFISLLWFNTFVLFSQISSKAMRDADARKRKLFLLLLLLHIYGCKNVRFVEDVIKVKKKYEMISSDFRFVTIFFSCDLLLKNSFFPIQRVVLNLFILLFLVYVINENFQVSNLFMHFMILCRTKYITIKMTIVWLHAIERLLQTM